MAAVRENIDITEKLQNQRKDYVKYRKGAARISMLYPNTNIGAAMADYCKALDAAIASVGVAMKIAR